MFLGGFFGWRVGGALLQAGIKNVSNRRDEASGFQTANRRRTATLVRESLEGRPPTADKASPMPTEAHPRTEKTAAYFDLFRESGHEANRGGRRH
jgi:hypothetical protein